MKKPISFSSMKKKGQVDPITITIGVVVLTGVLIFGYIGAYDTLEGTRYVIDPTTNITYDLLKCKSDQLPKGAIALTGGLDEFKGTNYKKAICP